MSLELTSGSRFAHYRIEELVGRGGMGLVYRAADLRLERPVALKLIAPELADDERFRTRFLRESRVAASLDHPNVIPIYEAGEEQGHLFIAMRYVDGSDLKALLKSERTLAPERALTIVGQVAAALDAAHDRGLVHRDVKPGNVLLDGGEHAYLTDFGLTKQLGGASTETGRMVGTFAYLAPEQIRGEPVEGRTDVYALACVLFECLAGEPPFRRETEAETLWAHMQAEPPAMPDHPALSPVWQRALAKTKDERYGSCRELVDAAREALRTGAAGVATIMFTDVEGSTALATRLGDPVAKELIEQQRRIVREEVERHGGRVIDSIGDGFMVAFESTRQALLCAVSVQERMAERAREDPEREVRLRIGLNAGEVLERGGHPFGAAVNEAQRVAAAARGGQVVASDSVRQLAGTIPGVSFRDRGRVRLKGFEEPRRLYEVVPRERPRDARTPWRRPTRRRLAALGALIVVGAAAAVAGVALLGGDGADDVGADALPVPPCGEVVSSSLSPDVLIASDLTLRGAELRAENQPLADAIRFVLRDHGFKAGKYTVGYQSCDNSSATQDLEAFLDKCGANAGDYARTRRLVAVIGNLYSACAARQIPILNRAPEGPLVMISPGNTKPGLTRSGVGAEQGEPEMYYPTGERNFFRVVPPDQFQGAAQAILAKRLSVRSVYVLREPGPYGAVLANAFRTAARKLDLRIAGSATWDPEAKSHAALAERVRRSGAQGAFLGGILYDGGAGVVRALRERLGARFTIMGGDGFHPIPDLLEATGPAARGMYVSVTGMPLDELEPRGVDFERRFGEGRRGRETGPYTVEAAQAAEVVLAAISRSDGTRASVLREVRSTEVGSGILGSFRFDRNGDISPAPVTIYRVTGATGQGVFSQFKGAGVDQVIRVPERLLR